MDAAGPFGASSPSPLVNLATVPPLKRDRLTCAIRFIMVIPQYIVLIFVGIAALVAVIIGWFAALATGQLPESVRTFLIGVIRWGTRVYGYFYFLTDDYPPFSLEPAEQYPVVVEFPAPVKLNPLAVLLRLFIAIPAWIVASVALSGLGVVSIVSWGAILFTGQLPNPLYEAARAVVRFQTRLAAYWAMITPEYPWGLLGDGPAEGDSSAAVTPGMRSPWTIRLSSQARTVMMAIIVIGVIVVIVRYF